MGSRTVFCTIIGIIIVLVDLGILLGLYFSIHNRDINDIYYKINVISNDSIASMTELINTIKHSLDRTSAVYRINTNYISIRNYTDYLQFSTNAQKDSIDSFFWISKIFFEEKDEYQDFCRENIRINCTLFQVGPNNTFIPVTPRSIYWILSYADPVIPVLPTIGFDMASHPTFNLFITTALTSTNATASYRVRANNMIQSNPNSYGIIISRLSLLDPSKPNASEVRGIAMAVVRIVTVVNTTLDHYSFIKRSDVDVLIFDVTKNETLDVEVFNLSVIYKENKPTYKDIWNSSQVPISETTIKRDLTIFNRQYDVYFIYTDEFIQSQESSAVIIIVATVGFVLVIIDLVVIAIYRTFQKEIKLEKDKREIASHILAYVNHEIRNPLNIIKGLTTLNIETLEEISSLLNKYKSLQQIQNNLYSIVQEDPEFSDYADSTKAIIKLIGEPASDADSELTLEPVISDFHTILASCNMLEHIVNDILTIRKLEAGKLDVLPEVFVIEDFITNVYKSIKIKLDENQRIEWIVDWDSNIKTICTDRYRLMQILMNYLTNALKFTESGSVTFGIKQNAGNIVFSIRDTGRGISEEKKRVIFEPFSQANMADATRHGGVGLGLYLCKLIADRIDGIVGFESELNVGSTFWIRFPINMINHPIVMDNEKDDDPEVIVY